jgi:tetratricopeptide (TPR) repeat protein
MDLNNPVIRLCVEGTQAEFQGNLDQARACYQKAWEAAQDDYEACIAAHYVARFRDNPKERLHWNQLALEKANRVADQRVQPFYPSLYLNIGQSYELLGNRVEAQKYYDLASELGVTHEADE